MTSTSTLIARNREFSKSFSDQDLPMLPKLRTVIVACPDARVDPTHTMNIDLGEAVVIRALGARITQDVINEIATIAFMAAKMDGDSLEPFELIVVQHTQCGAERFAHPEVQAAIKQKLGIDLAPFAISDHKIAICEDLDKLCKATNIPGYVEVSAYIYNVNNGAMEEVLASAPLSRLRR